MKLVGNGGQRGIVRCDRGISSPDQCQARHPIPTFCAGPCAWHRLRPANRPGLHPAGGLVRRAVDHPTDLPPEEAGPSWLPSGSNWASRPSRAWAGGAPHRGLAGVRLACTTARPHPHPVEPKAKRLRPSNGRLGFKATPSPLGGGTTVTYPCSPGRGKKPGPTAPTAASGASNVAC